MTGDRRSGLHRLQHFNGSAADGEPPAGLAVVGAYAEADRIRRLACAAAA